MPTRERALITGLTLAALAGVVTLTYRQLYYAIAPWVWSQNVTYPSGALTPYIQYWNAQRDGIEIYVLYAFMFLIIFSVCFLAVVADALRRPLAVLVAVVAAWTAIAWYGEPVVFTAPADWSLPITERLLLTGLLGAVLGGYLWLQPRIPQAAELALGIALLLPAAFVAVEPLGLANTVYVLAPAQKLLAGHAASEIYMQYELLVTATAALWLKAGGSITNFHLVGQASYCAAILAIFLVSRKMFLHRGSSWLLLIALVTVRILSSPWEPLAAIQIAPLRLELWLVPLLLIYLRGPFHWLVPASCGALMLLHGAFGVLYTIAYVQLLATLAVLRVLDEGLARKPRRWIPASSLRGLVAGGSYLLLCYVAAQVIFSKNIAAIFQYRIIGVGFLPLQESSFFWVFPALWAASFATLFLVRGSVTARYRALGFALLYFTLGNCVYFFGRSHEMVLFSIAIPLVTSVFWYFDTLGRWLSAPPAGARWIEKVPLACGLVILMMVSYACLDRISVSLSRKFESVVSLRLETAQVPPETRAEVDAVLSEVRELTGESASLEFMMSDGVAEFFFNEKTPGNTGFFYPSRTWIFLDDMASHAQSVLDRGTYLLCDEYLFWLFGARLHAGQAQQIESGSYVLVAPQQGVRR